MNKKIKTEIGMGIIIIVSIILGGLIWLGDGKEKEISKVAPEDGGTTIQDATEEMNEEMGSDFCEDNLDMSPDDEVGESVMKNEGWKKYINYRDGYEIDYPASELAIEGSPFLKASGGYYSVSVGYANRLGGYFGPILIYCGNIDSALDSALVATKKSQEEAQKYMESRSEEVEKMKAKEEIIKNEKLIINGMEALVIDKKVIFSAETVNIRTYFIQYKKDRVLMVAGPNESMFDKMVKTIAPISSKVSAPAFSAKPNISDIRKIEGGGRDGFEAYALSITNFKNSVWLCMQPDWYSKPDNKECNNGTLIESAESEFFASDFDNALLTIYSNSEQTEFYDGVYVSTSAGGLKIAPFSELCGLIKHNQDGSYFINNQRLLTVPGWKDLIPYINKEACVKGVQYEKSFRVYFIENKKS